MARKRRMSKHRMSKLNAQKRAMNSAMKVSAEKPFDFGKDFQRFAKSQVSCERYVPVAHHNYKYKGYNCRLNDKHKKPPGVDEIITDPIIVVPLWEAGMMCNINGWVDCGTGGVYDIAPCSTWNTNNQTGEQDPAWCESHYRGFPNTAYDHEMNQCIWCCEAEDKCVDQNWLWIQEGEHGFSCGDVFCEGGEDIYQCGDSPSCACLDPNALNYLWNCADTADFGSCNGSPACQENWAACGCHYAGMCQIHDINPDICTDVCCVYEIPGCTDTLACNYNEEASQNDGTCYYANSINEGIPGAPNLQYLNCDGSCINDSDGDGVCDEFEILGCTDQYSCNYEPSATDDNGSCDYSCIGCSDPDACNYEAGTTKCEDGSYDSCCEYESCVPDWVHCVTVSGLSAGAYNYWYANRQEFCEDRDYHSYCNGGENCCPAGQCDTSFSPNPVEACCNNSYADNYVPYPQCQMPCQGDPNCQFGNDNGALKWNPKWDSIYCLFDSKHEYNDEGPYHEGYAMSYCSGNEFFFCEGPTNGWGCPLLGQTYHLTMNQPYPAPDAYDFVMPDDVDDPHHDGGPGDGTGFYFPIGAHDYGWGQEMMNRADVFCDWACWWCGYPGIEICDQNGHCGVRYAERSGIMNQFSNNYKRPGCNCLTPDADVFQELWGCTDESADNYNPSATVDNGTCTYTIQVCCIDEVQGCGDEDACNYTGDAYYNVNNCEYPQAYCEDCDADGLPNQARTCGSVCPGDPIPTACNPTTVCVPCTDGDDEDDTCPCNQSGCDGVCCGCAGYDPCAEYDDCGVCDGNNNSLIDCWDNTQECDQTDCPEGGSSCGEWLCGEWGDTCQAISMGVYTEEDIYEHYGLMTNCNVGIPAGNSIVDCCGDCNVIAGSMAAGNNWNSSYWYCVGNNNQPKFGSNNFNWDDCKNICKNNVGCTTTNSKEHVKMYFCGDDKYCGAPEYGNIGNPKGRLNIGFAKCKTNVEHCNTFKHWTDSQYTACELYMYPGQNDCDTMTTFENAENVCGGTYYDNGVYRSCVQTWEYAFECAGNAVSQCGCDQADAPKHWGDFPNGNSSDEGCDLFSQWQFNMFSGPYRFTNNLTFACNCDFCD